jgi:type IV pilus biogenesis protein CpaD/CtpE
MEGNIMGILEDFRDILVRIDAATNDIAEDIRRLKDQIGVGMTPEQELEVKNQLESAAVRLEGIAADTENPVP